ncbi:MucR family transcriptional regulator [Mesorhizobium sp. WSM3224]|jgi:predicted transcriptional regulator|uniref:MucR family transcriptional regulator n=1 Tax=Mesorhizobium sp. WSM3224 TaxID=1040986 RepID=UPI00047FA027|nr:MucR family transcriptional regulator [Mesorhizobium sp. WSM3224]
MSEEIEDGQTLLIGLTADIVSAYVSNNPVPVASLSDLIASVNSSLSKIRQPTEPERQAQTPAVNPKRSVFPDYIISLEDGKKFKSLKRHLMTHYNLTPEEYREKWGLARDYPMVAPNYAAQRSELAKASGLGRKAPAKPAKKAPAKRSAARG